MAYSNRGCTIARKQSPCTIQCYHTAGTQVYFHHLSSYMQITADHIRGQTRFAANNGMKCYLYVFALWCSGSLCCLLTDQTSCIAGTGAPFYQRVLLLILLLMYHHNGGMYELTVHLNCLNQVSGLNSRLAWAARALHPLVGSAPGPSL